VGGLTRGESVIVALRDTPGMGSVSAIYPGGSKLAASTLEAPAATVLGPGADDSAAQIAFAQQVAAFARQASRIDDLWVTLRTACAASSQTQYDGGREWFALWDGRARADLSSGFCRDIYNQLVSAGAVISEGMEAAETQARRSLSPGTIREIRRRHAMDWEGWGRQAPDPAEL
jgi:hypothetical protein